MEICFEILSANKRYQSTDTSRPLLVSSPTGGEMRSIECSGRNEGDSNRRRFGPVWPVAVHRNASPARGSRFPQEFRATPFRSRPRDAFEKPLRVQSRDRSLRN